MVTLGITCAITLIVTNFSCRTALGLLYLVMLYFHFAKFMCRYCDRSMSLRLFYQYLLLLAPFMILSPYFLSPL